MHTIIYDTSSRAVLVLNPQLGADGKPILPLGVPTAAFAAIADAEAAKLSTPGDSFTLALDGVTIVVTPVVQPPTPLRDAVVAQAQSTVGATLASLTQAQRLALVACLLYSAGAIDPVTLTVRPLAQWLE